jgi:flagellar biosynthesis/type III secretory pathway protein FliH
VARVIPSGRARVLSPKLQRARVDADAVRARAHEDAAAIRERARAEGLASAEIEAAKTMIELASQASELRESASRDVASLALEIAGRVVHEAVCLDASLLERIVLRTLARAREESRVEVQLHPEDRAALTLRFAGHGGLPDTVRLVDAADQARGGCVVSSERIRIDARVESAIAAIARAMGVDAPVR